MQSSSTPEEKRERSHAQTPTNVPPLPASLRNSPVPIAAVVSIATAVNQTASSAAAGGSGISGAAFPPLDLNLGSKAPSTGKLMSWQVVKGHPTFAYVVIGKTVYKNMFLSCKRYIFCSFFLYKCLKMYKSRYIYLTGQITYYIKSCF